MNENGRIEFKKKEKKKRSVKSRLNSVKVLVHFRRPKIRQF